jgi:hypothetical protein
MGPKAGLDARRREKYFPTGNRTLAVQPVSFPTLNFGIKWEYSVHAPAALPVAAEPHGTRCIVTWLGSMEKNILPLPGIEPRSSGP